VKRTVKVIITAKVEDWWGYDDMVRDGLSRSQIIGVFKDDLFSLVEKAKWQIDDGKPVKKKVRHAKP